MSNLGLLLAYGKEEVKAQIEAQFRVTRLPIIINLDPQKDYPEGGTLRRMVSHCNPQLPPIKNIHHEGFYIEPTYIHPQVAIRKQTATLLFQLFQSYFRRFKLTLISPDTSLFQLPIVNLFAHSTSLQLALYPACAYFHHKSHYRIFLLDTIRQYNLLKIIIAEGCVDPTIWQRHDHTVPTEWIHHQLERGVNGINNCWGDFFSSDLIVKMRTGGIKGGYFKSFSFKDNLFPRKRVISKWIEHHINKYAELKGRVSNVAFRTFLVDSEEISLVAVNILEMIRSFKKDEYDIPYAINSRNPYLLIYFANKDFSDQIFIEVANSDFTFFNLFVETNSLDQNDIPPKYKNILRTMMHNLIGRIRSQGFTIKDGTGISRDGKLYFPIVEAEKKGEPF